MLDVESVKALENYERFKKVLAEALEKYERKREPLWTYEGLRKILSEHTKVEP
jgi:hypothetical protein